MPPTGNHKDIWIGRTRAFPARRLRARNQLCSLGRCNGSRRLPARPQLLPSVSSARWLDLDENSGSCTCTTHVAPCPHTGVGDSSLAVPVALDSQLVLQPFERTVVNAKVITNDLEPLLFQNVALIAAVADASLHKVVFVEDCVATVSERPCICQCNELDEQP